MADIDTLTLTLAILAHLDRRVAAMQATAAPGVVVTRDDAAAALVREALAAIPDDDLVEATRDGDA